MDIDPWTPTVTTQRYPKVGEKNPEVRLGLVEMDDKKTTWVNLNGNTYEYILRVDWMSDHKRVCVRTMNRLQTEVDLFFVDRASGEGKFIMKETDEGWVNLTDDLYFLEDGKHFIPILYDMNYEEFKRQQPIWRQCLGATTGISIHREGVKASIPGIIKGLRAFIGY